MGLPACSLLSSLGTPLRPLTATASSRWPRSHMRAAAAAWTGHSPPDGPFSSPGSVKLVTSGWIAAGTTSSRVCRARMLRSRRWGASSQEQRGTRHAIAITRNINDLIKISGITTQVA